MALTAVTDEAGFADVLTAAAANPAGFVDEGAEELAAMPPAELLSDWRLTRGRLHEALLNVADGRKLPWFGPPMSAASMATARLMETWAHGLDVADALGVTRPATDRLRSIAHLGVRTRDYAYFVNNLAPPTEQFLVELRGPAVTSGRGTGRCGPAGHRARRRFLLPGHPAATVELPAPHRDRRGCAAMATDRAGLRRPPGEGR
ncbi:hypothetical protein I551_0122 [Mycobacterium ulcerans str. Harvey]|uniref:Mycothiol-dependent maleylpyruvate isomerase metal-binding domain-containing protein n=1 Tax=Mycobacterium ulcerans str. Harvey TaxID=1299332 RepID=A0ABN0R8F4_MYCUL|nr:hypothetical protein I551_0122 [Mycobacterium ulcerans str. Harvey]